jgi:hypothetical protein
MITVIVGAVCILAGGFGGYQWGAAVERKAQAELAALQASAKSVASKL